MRGEDGESGKRGMRGICEGSGEQEEREAQARRRAVAWPGVLEASSVASLGKKEAVRRVGRMLRGEERR